MRSLAAAAPHQRRPVAVSAPAVALPARRHAPDPDLIITFDDDEEHAAGGARPAGGIHTAATRASTAVPASAPIWTAISKLTAGSGSPARLPPQQQLPAKRTQPAAVSDTAAGNSAVVGGKAAARHRPRAEAPPLGSGRALPPVRKAPATPAQRPGHHHSRSGKPRTPTDAEALRRKIQALEAKIQAAKRQQAAATAGRPDDPAAAAATGDAAAVAAQSDVSRLVDDFLSDYRSNVFALKVEPGTEVAADAAFPAQPQLPASGSGTSGSTGSSLYTSDSYSSRSWSSASGSASDAASDRSSADSGGCGWRCMQSSTLPTCAALLTATLSCRPLAPCRCLSFAFICRWPIIRLWYWAIRQRYGFPSGGGCFAGAGAVLSLWCILAWSSKR